MLPAYRASVNKKDLTRLCIIDKIKTIKIVTPYPPDFANFCDIMNMKLLYYG